MVSSHAKPRDLTQNYAVALWNYVWVLLYKNQLSRARISDYTPDDSAEFMPKVCAPAVHTNGAEFG